MFVYVKGPDEMADSGGMACGAGSGFTGQGEGRGRDLRMIGEELLYI